MEMLERMDFTLKDWLNNCFFIESDKGPSFQIIYDKNCIMKNYLSNLNEEFQELYKVIMIESSKSPTEFTDRVNIIKNFDKNSGWYRNKWIIYIYGAYSNKVKEFETFNYYERIGDSIEFSDISDLFLQKKINLLERADEIPILKEHPELNQAIFNQMLQMPLICFLNENKTLNKIGFWTTVLTGVLLPNSDATERDFEYIESNINKKEQIDITDLILELITRYDPIHFETSSLNPAIIRGFELFFKFLEKELTYLNLFSPSEDISKNILDLIKSITLFGKKSTTSQKQKGKSKNLKLDQFTKNIGTKKEPNVRTKRAVSTIIQEWISSSDEKLKSRYQDWMEIIRNEFEDSKYKINTPDIFNEKVNNFSFTGIFDIKLIEYILKNVNSDEYLEKISTTIRNRKRIWKKNASKWWEDNNIFIFDQKTISIEGLWQYYESIGKIINFQIDSKKTWENIESNIWELHQEYNKIQKPAYRIVINNLDCFTKLRKYISKADKRFDELENIFNAKFVDFYNNSLKKKPNLQISNVSENLFKNAIKKINENESIAFIFCDALRKDLALELMKKIQNLKKQNKSKILSLETNKFNTYTNIPSITGIGWASILRNSDELVYKGQYKKDKLEKVECIIKNKKNALISLNDFESREQRLRRIFLSSNNEISTLHLDSLRISQTLKIKKFIKKNGKSSKKEILIPVLWYEKIDNHDVTQAEFYRNIDQILNDICNYVKQLHFAGISHVYIFADHGFIFSNNANLIKEKPSGKNHSRYCLSKSHFTSDEIKKYSSWNIISPKDYGIELDSSIGDNLNVITPKNYGLFHKLKKDKRFLHGGLSYQECNISFIHSFCVLEKTVEIENILVINHKLGHNNLGEEAFVLKEESNGKIYLDLQIISSKPSKKAEKLKKIKIRLKSDNENITISPIKKRELKSNSKLNYKIYFRDNQIIDILELLILNDDNQQIYTQEIKIVRPSIYGEEELF